MLICSKTWSILSTSLPPMKTRKQLSFAALSNPPRVFCFLFESIEIMDSPWIILEPKFIEKHFLILLNVFRGDFHLRKLLMNFKVSSATSILKVTKCFYPYPYNCSPCKSMAITIAHLANELILFFHLFKLYFSDFTHFPSSHMSSEPQGPIIWL